MIYSENISIGKNGLQFKDKHGNPLTLWVALNKAVRRSFNWWFDLKLFKLHLISLHVPFWSVRKRIFILCGVKIGKGSTIHMGCKFFEPKNVTIGEDTIIGDSAFLDGREALIIGDHTDIASEVMIYSSEHDIESTEFEAKEEKVSIGSYVFIGPRAIILPGVKIEDGAVVGAGAVVTKNVGKNEIVGGVPAKVIGIRKNADFMYRLGRVRLFQ